MTRHTTPAQPATTGPADEAEGLAAGHGHYCAEGFPDADRPQVTHFVCKCGLPWMVTGCAFVQGVHAALTRDAAQQRIGAEKALREAADDLLTLCGCSPDDPDCENVIASARLRDRADRIAREGQA